MGRVLSLLEFSRQTVPVAIGTTGPNIMVTQREAIVHMPTNTVHLLPRRRPRLRTVPGVTRMEERRG